MRSELSEWTSLDWPKRVHCTGFAGNDLDVRGYVTRRNAADSFASAARQRVASVVTSSQTVPVVLCGRHCNAHHAPCNISRVGAVHGLWTIGRYAEPSMSLYSGRSWPVHQQERQGCRKAEQERHWRRDHVTKLSTRKHYECEGKKTSKKKDALVL